VVVAAGGSWAVVVVVVRAEGRVAWGVGPLPAAEEVEV
jgi:hypothetical protein